jgi:hypothetical protein
VHSSEIPNDNTSSYTRSSLDLRNLGCGSENSCNRSASRNATTDNTAGCLTWKRNTIGCCSGTRTVRHHNATQLDHDYDASDHNHRPSDSNYYEGRRRPDAERSSDHH